MKKTILLLLLAFIGWSTANAQLGIGTTTPEPSSVLDVTSTEKGFLPPRLTTAQRNVINGGNPAAGLVIYNTDVNCLQWWDGSGWYNACDGTTSGIIPGNATCAAATISVTPCSAVPGATLNDDNTTQDGTEYDWTGTTGVMSGGSTRALVEIGGQCWFRRNTIATPTAPCSDPINSGCNVWNNTIPGDIGSWGYYNTTTTNGTAGWGNTEPATGEGLLYQWSAAMNNATAERSQGVCPQGWHVPSDCEWMFLENTLGMSVSNQQSNGFRTSGNVDQKLSALTLNGSNSSGFTGLFAGQRLSSSSFNFRNTSAHWWSSTTTLFNAVFSREINGSIAGVQRNGPNKAFGYSVRCIKD